MSAMVLEMEPISKEYGKQRSREIGWNRRSAGKGGAAALVASIIAVGAIDALAGAEKQRADALAYFVGPLYLHHLSLLGLPADWLPSGVVIRASKGTRSKVNKFHNGAMAQQRE